MRTIPLPWSPSVLGFAAVCVMAAAMGSSLLWATGALQGSWLIALITGLTVLWLAIASGRFERFMLGLLFLIIPVNVDVHFTPGVNFDALQLPSGTPRLGLSIMDLILCFLYLIWIARLLTKPRSLTSLWPPAATPLVCLIGWAALSIVNAQEPRLSLFVLAGFAKAFLCFFYIANHIKTRDDLRLVAGCLIAGLILESLIACAQHASGGLLGLEALGERSEPKLKELSAGTIFRIGGTLGNPNFLGGYLAAVLPVTWALTQAKLRWATRLVIVGASVLGTIVLVLTLSRSAWLSAALACLMLVGWLLINRQARPRIGGALIITLILGATLTFLTPLIAARLLEDDGGAAASRLGQVRVAWSVVTSHPILGVGLNNYEMVVNRYETQTHVADERARGIVVPTADRLHNIYLLMVAETGWMSVVWLGWFLWIVARRAWQRIIKGQDELVRLVLLGMAIAFFTRLAHDAVHTGHLSLNTFFWVYSAILVARSQPADE